MNPVRTIGTALELEIDAGHGVHGAAGHAEVQAEVRAELDRALDHLYALGVEDEVDEPAAAEDLDGDQEWAVAGREGELQGRLAVEVGQVEAGHDGDVLEGEHAAGDRRDADGVADFQLGRGELDRRSRAAEQAWRQDVGQRLDELQRP